MNTAKQIFLAAILVGAMLSSCEKQPFSFVKGKGANVTETRTISGFNEISLDIDADVEYVQDSVYYVEISAQDNILEVLSTNVHNQELNIGFTKNVVKHNPIHIIIHSPEINSFEISGSGSILAFGSITSTSMNLEISGSGNIELPELNCSYLESDISGSGNIQILAGNSDQSSFKISGSGDVQALHFSSKTAEAKISGSGNISLKATEFLNAEISGSGDITYDGTPAVTVSISGSGRLVHL